MNHRTSKNFVKNLFGSVAKHTKNVRLILTLMCCLPCILSSLDCSCLMESNYI
jgi:hypothetical protein